MNISTVIDLLRKSNDGKSFSVLAHRVPKSHFAPYKIDTLDNPIKTDDATVLVLGGSGGEIISYNALVRDVTNFVRSNKEMDDARVCVAAAYYGEKYIDAYSRESLILNKRYPLTWFVMKNIMKHPLTKMDAENYNPHAVSDIFDSVFAVKIAKRDAKRLPINELLKNLRTVTIVAYCAGGNTAMQLEQFIAERLKNLGYSGREIRTALNQITVIGYAMDCPYEKSNMRFFGFNSLVDDTCFNDAFRTYLQINRVNFDLMHVAKNNSDTFFVDGLRESTDGIMVAQPIDEYLAKNEAYAEFDHVENKDDNYNEHTFLGFVEKKDFGKGAKQLQSIFKNVITNSVINSIHNAKGNKFVPLAPTADLVGKNVNDLGRADVKYLQEHTLYAATEAVCANIVEYADVLRSVHHRRKINIR